MDGSRRASHFLRGLYELRSEAENAQDLFRRMDRELTEGAHEYFGIIHDDFGWAAMVGDMNRSLFSHNLRQYDLTRVCCDAISKTLLVLLRNSDDKMLKCCHLLFYLMKRCDIDRYHERSM